MARASTKPTTTLLLLVRHGRTPTTGKILPGRAKGLHLSDEVRQQAEAVAKRITSTLPKIDAIYCSPLERCRETAAPLAAELGMKAQAERGLLECDFGDWTGMELKKLAKLPERRSVQQAPSQFRFPNGESYLELQARITDTAADFVARHRGGVVVAFSHADPIKALMTSALGSSIDMFQRVNVSPCSVSALLYGASTPTPAPTVLTLNAVDDFGSLQPS